MLKPICDVNMIYAFSLEYILLCVYVFDDGNFHCCDYIGSDSGPKRLSWGMSLRRPAVVEKLGKSSNDDSPRCHTTPVVSSFSEVILISTIPFSSVWSQ